MMGRLPEKKDGAWDSERGKKWNQIVRNSSEDALAQVLSSSSFPKEAVHTAHAELIRRAESRPSLTPALDQWRREMVTKERDAFTFDDLWRKACEEMSAMESILSRPAPPRSRPAWSDQEDKDLPF